MEENKSLNLEISVTNTKQFQSILTILGKIITDGRIEEHIRISYFKEIMENII